MPLLLISPTNAYATKRLQEEALLANVELQSFDVADLAKQSFNINPSNFSLLYVRQAYPYFREVIDLAEKFKAAEKPVVDAGIAEGDLGLGKLITLQKLQASGVSTPKTNFVSTLNQIDFKSPLIAKWNYGFGGKHTYLVKNPADLDSLTKKYPSEQLLLQEFIPAEFEYKLITVGYKALPLIIKLKTNHNKFLPDFSKYEILQLQNVPEVVSLAERAAKILGRELAKVDILEAGGKLYILEVNRWPGLQTFEKLSGYNVAQAFITHLNNRADVGL